MRRKDREVTDSNVINEILRECKTCRVAMVDEGEPYVVPLSYGYELSGRMLTLYFHCAWEGRKLDILKKNNRVCFEISKEGKPLQAQTPCNFGYYFSGIMGYGNVELVEDAKEKCEALSLLMRQQADREVVFTKEQADTVCVLKVESSDYTGKQKRTI